MLYYYCVSVTHLLVDNNILKLRAVLEEKNKKLEGREKEKKPENNNQYS